MDNFDIVNPDPGAMIEALRAFGYNLGTSIADIVDNAIWANATDIWIDFTWNGEHSTVSIKDNGRGMSASELMNAMRPGSKNPLEDRDLNDLGRFGLGLKTASFAQCRKLTVGSKIRGGDIRIRCWDLDYINQCHEWRLIDIDPSHANEIFSQLESQSCGTIVLWNNIDRIVKGFDLRNSTHENLFYEQIDLVKDHLSMVFHRFLERKSPIHISINNRPISPWDPFLKGHPSTQHLPEERIIVSGQRILIKPYVLPHRSKLDDRSYKKGGGPGGWHLRQGFYIYRSGRLIVLGDWLGLGFRKEEFTKLARIQVDLPNSIDQEWNIDVKKSIARPPASSREEFKRIARLTIDKAIAIYKHRGKVARHGSSESFYFPWETGIYNGEYFYRINRSYPLVKELTEDSGESGKKIRALLRIIEETVPTPLIVLKSSTNPDIHRKPFENSPTDELRSVMEAMWDALIRSGVPASEAGNRLLNTEPFSDYPEYTASFIELKSSR